MSGYGQSDRIGRVSNSPAFVRASPIGAANPGAFASGAAHWVCVHHRPGLGSQVKFALRRDGLDVHWPREEVSQGRKKDPLIRPLFPGYLFAMASTPREWSQVASCPNVLGILGSRTFGRPTLIPDRIVEQLIEEAGSIDGLIDRSPEARAASPRRIAPGPVWFDGGAFDRLKGILETDDGKAFVEVLTEVFGAQRKVMVPREQVRAEG